MRRSTGSAAATCAARRCSCCDAGVPRARSIWLVITLALIAGATLPHQAVGLPPGRSGLYGGGAVRDYLQFVSVRVLPGGRFTAHATLVTSCAPRFGDALTESVSVRGARLSDDGRYSATTSFSDELEPGVPTVGGLRAKGTIDFSVRLLAGGRAHGAVRVRSTYSDPSTGAEVSRCDTGRIPWALRRPAPDSGSGRAAPRFRTYRGTTDQDEPFLMRVARSRRLVRRAGMTVRVGCPSGIGLPLDVVAHLVRIRRGRFGATDEFERPYTYPDGSQVVERYSWKLRGRFGRSGARGTFELHGDVHRRSDGEPIGSCDTGVIDWRAGG
jgi:hypothetical protein